MRLPRTSTRNSPTRAFSIVEVLVVIGLLTMIFSLGLFLSMDVWRGSSFRGERDLVLSLLYKARSRALSNINENPHGLYINSAEGTYVLFEGESYEAREQEQAFEMDSQISYSGENEFVFEPHEATTEGGTLTISGQGKESTIDINYEGGINW